jgi:RAP1 GTPase activating protein 1
VTSRGTLNFRSNGSHSNNNNVINNNNNNHSTNNNNNNNINNLGTTNGPMDPRALSETSDDCSLNSVDLDPMGKFDGQR